MDSAVSRGSKVPWRATAWASVALAALVAKAEAGSVIGEATPTGQYSVGSVYGAGQLTRPLTPPAGTLSAWAQASHQFADLWLWLILQAGFDVVFVAGYAGLSVTLIKGAWTAGWASSSPAQRLGRYWPLFALVAANLIQAGLAVAAFAGWIRPHHDVPAALAIALEAAVIAKWLLGAAFIAVLGYRLAGRRDVIRQLRLIARALKKQRFSLVIVVLLGVVAIARGSGVLEQMPDVERAWLTWPPSLGWAHLAFAVAAQALLALLLVLLSALRLQRARASVTPGDDRDAHSYLPWLLTSLAVPALALALRSTDTATVSWYVVFAIPAVLSIVAAASFVTSRVTAGPSRVPAGPSQVPVNTAHAPVSDDVPGTGPAGPAGPAEVTARAGDWAEDPHYDRTVSTTGDMLAVAVIAVTGLGLVRAFTAAAMVAGRPYSWAFGVAVAIGFAVAALSWTVARRPLQDLSAYFAEKYHSTGRDRRKTGRSLRRAAGDGGEDGKRPPVMLLAVSAIPFVTADILLIFVPLWTVHWLGVLAVTVIALGTLAVGLAVLAYLVQSRKPLPVFTLLRLKTTPVIALVVIVALAGTVLGEHSELHDIRVPPAVAASSGTVAALPAATPTLLGSLRQWLASPATISCAVAAPAAGGAVRIEPLVLVAAAGGGIRAAWWTVQALDTLASTPCRRHAVFAASGVSGGSLGLAIMDTMNTAGERDAALARVAGPDALAAAIDGMLLRDTIAGLTGLDLTAASMPAGQRFPDRAALLEHEWESEDTGLARPFPAASPPLPWRMMFNSTAVSTGCRAIIADRLIATAARPAVSTPACGLTSAGPVPDSYDFFAELPCLRGIDTATAALLSARFPYITPSGVVNGCGSEAGTQVEQYVDGGYADSTGLATLAGLAPELVTAIRQYNADALRNAGHGRPVTLVVPVTAYLGNSPQPEPAVGTPAGSPPQPLIPLESGAASAQGQLSNSTALLQQLAAATAASQWLYCAPGDSRCASDQAAAAAAVPQQLFLVVPREYPAVSAPLGWVLSAASRAALTKGVATEAASTCPDPGQNELYCPHGVGRLGDLLHLIGG